LKYSDGDTVKHPIRTANRDPHFYQTFLWNCERGVRLPERLPFLYTFLKAYIGTRKYYSAEAFLTPRPQVWFVSFASVFYLLEYNNRML
jgi:hypothetical protein